MTVEWWAAISRGVMDGLGEDGRRTCYGIIAPHGVRVRVRANRGRNAAVVVVADSCGARHVLMLPQYVDASRARVAVGEFVRSAVASA